MTTRNHPHNPAVYRSIPQHAVAFVLWSVLGRLERRPNNAYLVTVMKLPTSIALDLDLREAVDRLAAAQDRSRSWVVERLVREGLAREAVPVDAQAEQLAR
jgi:Ribbon-helix-helix protein, copG family